MNNNNKYKVYTDGGCAFNPGGKGGYGCVIIAPNGGEYRLLGGYTATTNNRMEIMAAVMALKSITEPSYIELYSDSKYVINTMKGLFSQNKNQDLWKLLEEQKTFHKSIEWVWVKGHSDNKYNEICDQLATEAMNLDNLESDYGYNGPIANLTSIPSVIRKSSFNAMKVNINVPKETYREYQKPASKEALERKCNVACIELIRDFYKKDNHSFNDYSKLKTYGKDELSLLKSAKDFIELIGSDKYNELKNYFKDEKEIYSAARWIARGLTLYDSIRKVYIDREIALNIMSNSQDENK